MVSLIVARAAFVECIAAATVRAQAFTLKAESEACRR